MTSFVTRLQSKMEAVPRMPMLAFDLKNCPETVDLTPVLKTYISEFYHEDAESYSKECSDLEQLRRTAVHVSRDFVGCSTLKRYYCQLSFLASRFPLSSGEELAVPFTWEDAHTGRPVTVSDIKFEQASILYNIGSLHSILGSVDNRQTPEGMKVSCTHFQCAAWAYEYLRDSFGPSLSTDTDKDLLSFQINLMLAQAQECILEKSMADNRKSSITSKVAAQIISFYKQALKKLDDSNPSNTVGSRKYKEWKRRIELKVAFHECVMYVYLSNQAEDQQNWGERLAYCTAALDRLKEAIKLAKSDGDSDIEDSLNFTMDVVGGKYNSAKKDNDLVYNEKVPALDSLPEVKGASLVKGIPFNPQDTEVSGKDIFHRLVPMEAHEASSVYSEEKAKLLRVVGSRIEDSCQELSQYLESLQLDPASINPEPERLPDALLEKCAALSVKPDTIKDLVSAMQSLSSVATDVEGSIGEITVCLEQEAERETEFQKVCGKRTDNVMLSELAKECEKYKEGLHKASNSNLELHKAMNTHISNLKLLSSPLEELKQALPAVALERSPEDQAVIDHMQKLLGKVEEMRSQRSMLEQQLREQVMKDDITSTLAVRTDANQDAFFKEEIKKHQKTVALIDQNIAAQPNILRALTEANAKYADIRRQQNEVKLRRSAMIDGLLQSCDVYEDLLAKVNKGVDFYKKLETNVKRLLDRTQRVCKVQEEERQQILDRLKPKAPPPSRPVAPKPGQGSVPDIKPSLPSTGAPTLKDFLPMMKPGTWSKSTSSASTASPAATASMATAAVAGVDTSLLAQYPGLASLKDMTDGTGQDQAASMDIDPSLLAKYPGLSAIGGAAIPSSQSQSMDVDQALLAKYPGLSAINKGGASQYSSLPGSHSASPIHLPRMPSSQPTSPMINPRYRPQHPQSLSTVTTDHGASQAPTAGLSQMIQSPTAAPGAPSTQRLAESGGMGVNTGTPPGGPSSAMTGAGGYLPSHQPVALPSQAGYTSRTQDMQQPPVTVQQPPTSIQKPSVSMQQPPVSMQQPPVSLQQPPVSMQQPPVSLQQPPVSLQQPPVTMQQPPVSMQQLPVSLQQPPVSTQIFGPMHHYGISAQQPGVSAQQPGVSAQQPGVSAQPDVTAQQPGVSAQQPGVSAQQLGVSAQQPGVSAQQPGVSAQQPGVSAQQPGVSVQQPGVSAQQPGVSAQQPGIGAQQQSVIPQQYPQYAQYPHQPGDQNPSLTRASYSHQPGATGYPRQQVPPSQNKSASIPRPASAAAQQNLPHGGNQSVPTGLPGTGYQAGMSGYPCTTVYQQQQQPASASTRAPVTLGHQLPASYTQHQSPAQPQNQIQQHQFPVQPQLQIQQHQSPAQPQHHIQQHQSPAQLQHQIQQHQPPAQGQHQIQQHQSPAQPQHQVQQHQSPAQPLHQIQQHQSTIPTHNQITHNKMQPHQTPGTPSNYALKHPSGQSSHPQSQASTSVTSHVHQAGPPATNTPQPVGSQISYQSAYPLQHSTQTTTAGFPASSYGSSSSITSVQPGATHQSQSGYQHRAGTGPSAVSQAPSPAAAVQGHQQHAQGQQPSYMGQGHYAAQGYSQGQTGHNQQQHTLYMQPLTGVQTAGYSTTVTTAGLSSYTASTVQSVNTTQTITSTGQYHMPQSGTGQGQIHNYQGQMESYSLQSGTQPGQQPMMPPHAVPHPGKVGSSQSQNMYQSQPMQHQGQVTHTHSQPNLSQAQPYSFPGAASQTQPSQGQMRTSNHPQQPSSFHAQGNTYNQNYLNQAGAQYNQSPSDSSHPQHIPTNLPSPIKPAVMHPSSTPPTASPAPPSLSPAPLSRESTPTHSSASSQVSSSQAPAGQGVTNGNMQTATRQSSVDDILSVVDDTAEDRMLTPKVITAEDLQREKEEKMKNTLKQPHRDPYLDTTVLQKFVTEVEKYDKLVESLNKQTLSGPTPLEKEWKELNTEQEKFARMMSSAIARCYPLKNRFPDIIPYDSTRIILKTSSDDYINANDIGDLAPSCPKFIAAQNPLPGTIEEFWCMVYEQGSEVIVSLCCEVEGSQKNHVYWPQEKGQTIHHGCFTLTLQSTRVKGPWEEHIITLNHKETRHSRSVVHLQFTQWPASGLPESPAPLLVFISEVHSFYVQQRSLMKPVIVHCSNGVGRTGVFCIVYTGVQQIDLGQGIVNVAELVTTLRKKRRWMVQERSEHLFSYQAILYHAQALLMKRGILTHHASFGDKLPAPGSQRHQRTPSDDLILGGPASLSSLQSSVARMNIRTTPTKPDDTDKSVPDSNTEEVTATQSQIEDLSHINEGQGQIVEGQGQIFEGQGHSSGIAEEHVFREEPDVAAVLNETQAPASVIPSEDSVGQLGQGSEVTPRGSSLPPSLADLQNPNTFNLDSTPPTKRKITKASFMSKTSTIDKVSDPGDPLSQLDPLWSIKNPPNSS